MAKNLDPQESKNVSLSSVETQRKLRIEKMDKLREIGHEPFAVKSHRDFSLGFVRFWFDFVHEYDLERFQEDFSEIESQYFFLDQVLFPPSLVEKQEERLFMRQTMQDLGMDFSDGELQEEFEEKELNEARKYFPNLLKIPEETREKYLSEFFRNLGNENLTNTDEVEVSLKSNQRLTLAGRIKSKRMSGKIGFATVEDESLPEGFQFIFRKDLLGGENVIPNDSEGSLIQTNPTKEDSSVAPQNDKYSTSLTFHDLKTLIDEGDYIQASGVLETSQRGEPSLFVESFRILTKSLRPLPESLDYENFEERYTNRVVDFKMNTLDPDNLSVRDMVRLKQKYWAIWREEMLKEGFLEVECPIFEHIPGGAEAKPFTTFYNELDQEVFLRISLELPLKKLIAGGFEKVFEIGRIFRNEGSSPQHLQEYTQIEWYWAYADYTDGMKLTKRIYQRIVQEILGQMTQIDYYGHRVDWGEWCSLTEARKHGWGLATIDRIWEPNSPSPREGVADQRSDGAVQDYKEGSASTTYTNTSQEGNLIFGWPIIPYYEAVRHYSGGKVDFEGKSFEDLMQIAKENDVEVESNIDLPRLMDKIYKKLARPNIHHPIFLALVPVELEPLAKRNPEQPHLTERWQIVAGTAELGKCFSELNDPVDQFGRFEQQQAARDAGDEEAQFMDEDYVKALELGTPPMAGLGTSERFLSFLLGKHIKECVTFPHVRSEDNKTGRAKRTMVAHAVILDEDGLEPWQKYNSVAHLCASFAGREGKSLFFIDQSQSKDGEIIPMNIQHAIVIKKSTNSTNLLGLKRKAEENGLMVSVFTQEMQDTSDDAKVDLEHSKKKASNIRYLGVLIYGRKGDVEKLTEGFERI